MFKRQIKTSVKHCWESVNCWTLVLLRTSEIHHFLKSFLPDKPISLINIDFIIQANKLELNIQILSMIIWVFSFSPNISSRKWWQEYFVCFNLTHLSQPSLIILQVLFWNKWARWSNNGGIFFTILITYAWDTFSEICVSNFLCVPFFPNEFSTKVLVK